VYDYTGDFKGDKQPEKTAPDGQALRGAVVRWDPPSANTDNTG
jgi:hypothetical protein